MNRTLGIGILATASMSLAGSVAGPTVAHADLRSPAGQKIALARRVVWAPDQAPAWRGLLAEVGPAWASWDRASGVPSRILLQGIDAPDSIASPDAAARFGEAFVARHLELLAPGCDPSDFVLVANDLDGGIRSLGFAQTHHGRPVVGGQLSLRFKHDRLVAIGSEVVPHLAASTSPVPISPDKVERAAVDWAESAMGPASAHTTVTGPMVLPWAAGTKVAAREVMAIELDIDRPRDRQRVYVDATTAAVVAHESVLHHATAPLLLRVPERGPLAERVDLPAPLLEVAVDGQALVTDAAGVVTWPGGDTVVTTTVTGPLVTVLNATGEPATATLPLSDGIATIWNEAGDEARDAQLTAYAHAHAVKNYVAPLAGSLPWLSGQLQVTVNIDDECNAFSDGDTINFFLGSDGCANTGRLSDVVYHEFGHSLHAQSIIEGVGRFSTPLSEGISDYLSATITGDPGVGRGFFNDATTPLRQLDPEGSEFVWPEDRGEVHDEGRIIGGALWDLRKELVAKLGAAQGVAHTDFIWYQSIRRAVDIPSMYAEALLADDDDGNLANGTPNVCEINAAFGAHGLFAPQNAEETVTLSDRDDGGHDVTLSLSIPDYPQCPVSVQPTMAWQLREDLGTAGDTAMTPAAGGWQATIPAVPAGSVLQYQVATNYTVGTERSLPDNIVDPFYETFVGDVTVLYCTGFEDGGVDWTFGGDRDDFEVGSPIGAGGDPRQAFAGTAVLGNDLSDNGTYRSRSAASATSPPISTQGFRNVRLQYRRWLNVEDGWFDRARIYSNDVEVWANHLTPNERQATFHHEDREWRFHDVDISDTAAAGSVQVRFELDSDGGLELGGWTLDEVCVVGFGDDVGTCGDGVLTSRELCDDGNLLDGDGCSAQCEPETDDPDPGAETGDGPDEPGLDGDLVDRGCACTMRADDGPGPGPWLSFAGLVAVGLLRRRRA